MERERLHDVSKETTSIVRDPRIVGFFIKQSLPESVATNTVIFLLSTQYYLFSRLQPTRHWCSIFIRVYQLKLLFR